MSDLEVNVADEDADDTVIELPSTGEIRIAPGRFNTPMGREIKKYFVDRLLRSEITGDTARRGKTVLGFFAESYGAKAVAKIGPEDLDRWLATRGHISPATRRNELSIMRGFIQWLQRKQAIKADPLRYVKRPRVPRSVPRALTRDEVDALWAVLPDSRARAIVSLMLHLGLRRVEVLHLQNADWDQREQTVRIVGKGGHARVLPVPPTVASALTTYLREGSGGMTGPMIRTNDCTRGISNSYLGRLMYGWMREAGIKHRNFDGRACHSLRHTLASDIADVEPDLRVLQQILGHASLTSTQIYLRQVQLPKMRAAMEAAAQAAG